MQTDKKLDGPNGNDAPALIFEVVIKLNPATQEIFMQGPLAQPVILLGMLEMAKELVLKTQREGGKKKKSLITMPV